MPEKILLVDDDKDFRYLFHDYLEGYDIIEASSGDDALAILKRPNEIDLVVLDVVMPGISGTDVLKEIKKANPDLSVIILTAYGSKDMAVEALRSHADDFIEKGKDMNSAKDIIDAVLEKKKGGVDGEPSNVKGKIEKVKRFIERNCFKKITLIDAAASVCLSPKYLSRLFKQSVKMGFSDYKLKIKIAKAKQLLVKANYNINQLSDKLGYQNAESFIRQFKRFTGLTPTAFRKKNKKR
ncbi:MAG TPA: response regulator [Candidatus Omnitrophota bacterium]|nr:response regulator [Candidatus Omnitrophota bacterium]HPT06907.1 response regulator [Candidatus Omnitrophota bacterium]